MTSNLPKRPELRKTKIVATIGPACDTPEMLTAMIEAGMSVARLNLSHGTHAEHKGRIDRLRAAAQMAGANIAIMIDTRGIEIRTKKLMNDTADLAPGDTFILYTEEYPGDSTGVTITYRKLPEEVRAGTPILLDDGAIELEVKSVVDGAIVCRVVHGGRLGNNKSVNLPETRLAMSAVSPENREDVVRELSFACENDVDYIAASFIQSADDIHKMREILTEHGVSIPIIAKIENKAGVANLDEIVEAADGVMVARGDLGVELPLADVPSTQKKIIRMTEASDVANAILDGTSAVMLSGETAAGKYPLQAVKTMATVALRAEASLSEYGYLQKIKPNPANVVTEAISQATVSMTAHLKAAAIISLTETGYTSRQISKYRPDCPILAITASPVVVRKLSMNWGVIPVLYNGEPSDNARIDFGIARARELLNIGPGDILVVAAGQHQKAGGTDLIRVITLEN
jgi:pyruvate kinase